MDYCMSSAWDGPITQSECCVNVKYCYLNSLRAFKIFVYIYIYIFIYLWLCWVFTDVQTSSSFDEQGLLSSCGVRASHCGGLSCCGARALGHVGLNAVVHGLSSSAACGICPHQGLNLYPLHWQVDSQPLDHQGRPSESFLWPHRHLRRKRLCLLPP